MAKTPQDEIYEYVEKAKIVEVLFRYCRGVDRADGDTLKSAFWPDARDEHSFFQGNAHDYADFMVANAGKFGTTSHVVTNWSIDLQGDVAFVESYGMGIDQGAMIDGKPTFLLAVGRNLDRFEKRDGEWRIALRRIVYDLNQTAEMTESWEGDWFGKWKPRGVHYPHDLVYKMKDGQ